MASNKLNNIKIPTFDKENYGLWKRKMTLYIRAANPRYIDILNNGPPKITETIMVDGEDGINFSREVPKDPSKYDEKDKETASLDDSLQLILIDSLNDHMYNQVVNCTSAKEIWETISIICEGTDEVRENQ